MKSTFVSRISKGGKDRNGKERRLILIPGEELEDVLKKFNGDKIKVILEKI